MVLTLEVELADIYNGRTVEVSYLVHGPPGQADECSSHSRERSYVHTVMDLVHTPNPTLRNVIIAEDREWSYSVIKCSQGW